MAPLRIAILECDTPIPPVLSTYGRYGDIITRMMLAAGATMEPPILTTDVHFTKWDVVEAQEYPNLEDVDHIIVSGGKYNAFDMDPWIIKLTEFIQKVLLEQDRIRVVGLCFGHQIVGRALGGVCDRNEKGWEISITEVNLSEIGRGLFGRNSFNIMQMHRDHLVTLPISPFASLPDATLEILGETDMCAVQGLYTPGKVLTVQGHPEFDATIMKALCQSRMQQGIFNKAIADDGISRSDLKNDGTTRDGIAVGFWKFFLD